MPLIEDVEGIRKRELLALLDDILNPVRQDLQGAVVVGSLGYNWRDTVFTTSDLDLMLVVNAEDLVKVLHQAIPAGSVAGSLLAAASAAHSLRVVEMISIKGHHQGLDYTLHLLDLELFEEIGRWQIREVRSWRAKEKAGPEEFHSLTGKRISYAFRNDLLATGCCHWSPTSLEDQDDWYLGVPHGRLLHAPQILEDVTGRLRSGVDRLWSSFLRRGLEKCAGMPGNGRFDPLQALAKSHHFGHQARKEILRKTEAGIHNLLDAAE